MIDKIYKYFKKHWLISTLIVTIPTYWFTLIKLVGENIGLVDSGKLNVVGIVISIIIFIISLGFALIKNYKDNQESEKISSNQYILQKILTSVNSVCSKKSDRYIEFINYNQQNNRVEPFNKIAKPKLQVKDIIEEIKICLSDIADIDRENIGVSIIYKDNISDKWEWFYNSNRINDLSLKEITENASSTARQVIDGRHTMMFVANKKTGQADNTYVKCKSDDSFNLIGSIVCKAIDVILDDKKFINSILSITTYGNLICEDNDEDAKNTISNIMLPPFEQRLKLELALHYIKNVANIKEDNDDSQEKAM